MNRPFRKLQKAFAANLKPVLWLLLTYIPVSLVAGYLGSWLIHTWAMGFIVAGAYMLALMFIWARMLMYISDSNTSWQQRPGVGTASPGAYNEDSLESPQAKPML